MTYRSNEENVGIIFYKVHITTLVGKHKIKQLCVVYVILISVIVWLLVMRIP